MKRAALAAASALSLTAVLTAVLTACSGGEPDAKPQSSPSSRQARQPAPAERLAKLMVTKTDLSGDEVSKPTTEYAFAKSQDDVTLDQAACAPLAYAMNQLPLGAPQADLTRYVGNPNSTYTYITLSTYAPGKAEAAVSGLSKAVGACGGGFTAKASGGTSTYDSVTAEKALTTGGLAFRSTLTFRGVQHTLHTEAVRHDDVVAVFFSVDGAAIAGGRPSDAKLPTAVVKAQEAKLG
ncbi:hypothetical protein [Streptomyces sp. S.PNR 29]|uniref:hypothetical protein n=1 Tax=Streptomyces sp. S.PNR 29 TaxID=2973805 RepID=UPI0025B05512|nr:hypothetical protein [Streptomyces sp. S.PNR 29]MDN0193588.1 hypothetical protein [Streptomyces sp. S.PNR 29]